MSAGFIKGASSTFSGDAGDVTFTPAGNIIATDVQAAIEELDTDKATASHSHASSDITDFGEDVADVVAGMVSSNTETGITVTYDDADNTIDFAVTYGDTANTAVQGNDDRVAITGFENRTDSTLSLSTRTVSLTGTFNIYSDGVKYAKTGGASCSTEIADTVGLHYIYFDSTGTLQNSTSAWDITSINVPTAIVYWNGSAGVLYDERHSAFRDPHWHQWAHNTIGTRYISGLDGTFTTAAISVTRGYIADEDIVFDTGATKTDCLVWYRNSTTMTFNATPATITANVAAGALKYDNAGSLASVDNSKFVTNWLYCTTETTTPLMLVTGQAQYATIALARTAPLPTFPNMPTAELKVIYRIIWQNQGGTPTYVENTDYRSASTLPAGGTPSVSAAGVTFAASGNIASTNVQSAIEELDTEKQATSEKNANNGYAGLNSSGYVAHGQLGSGGGGSTKFLREDNSWQTVSGGTGAAEDITFTPYGDIEATDVQAAIEELDDEKATASHSHGAGDISDATATPTASKIPIADASALLNAWITAFDVVGGRLDLVSATSIKWGFQNNNQIKLFNPTSGKWELVLVSTEPTLANTATDFNGTALAVDKIYDVFAEYVNSTSFVLKCSRWQISGAGISSRVAEYVAATAYNIGDRVYYSGQIYVCIQAGTGQTPSSSPSYWVSNGAPTGGDGSLNSQTASATPAMTSNSAPSPCVASATASDGTRPPFHAFDQSDSSVGWKSGRAFNTQNYEVLSFDFGVSVPKVINKYRLKSLNEQYWNTDGPTAWTLRGSNLASPSLTNDSDWTSLHSVSGYSWSGQNVFSQYFTFTNSTPYRHYSIKFTAINGTPASNWVAIGEIHFVQASDDFAGLYRHDGILVSDSSTTGKKRRWLGVIYTYNNSSTVNFKDSGNYRFISNHYNQKPKSLVVTYNNEDWSYSTDTYRESNNGGLTRGSFVSCVYQDISITACGYGNAAGTNNNTKMGISINVTTEPTRKAISYGTFEYVLSITTVINAIGHNWITTVEAVGGDTGINDMQCSSLLMC